MILAEGHNFAKRLNEAPANIMTPTQFCSIAEERLGVLAKVEVRAR